MRGPIFTIKLTNIPWPATQRKISFWPKLSHLSERSTLCVHPIWQQPSQFICSFICCPVTLVHYFPAITILLFLNLM